jgi:hypothetical protein
MFLFYFGRYVFLSALIYNLHQVAMSVLYHKIFKDISPQLEVVYLSIAFSCYACMASLCENLLGFGHPMFVSFVTLTGNTVYKFSINDIFNNSYCTVFPFPSSDSHIRSY